MNNLANSQLGKKSAYICEYDADLLFPILRAKKRAEINIFDEPPFHGYDIWNAYELSWLNQKYKPQVAVARFIFPSFSSSIIESKSFKLYLNSFNNTVFKSIDEVKSTLIKDLSNAVGTSVELEIYLLHELEQIGLTGFEGKCLDELDISMESFVLSADLLLHDGEEIVEEVLYSNLLKSNCLVTGQPDWGSIQITYHGRKISQKSLLKYIVSYRNHNEFHEQCVERIFMDLMAKLDLNSLTVYARYTRRGGLDINPIRSTAQIKPKKIMRMVRQ